MQRPVHGELVPGRGHRRRGRRTDLPRARPGRVPRRRTHARRLGSGKTRLSAPFLTAFGAAALRLYPFQGRLILFLFPLSIRIVTSSSGLREGHKGRFRSTAGRRRSTPSAIGETRRRAAQCQEHRRGAAEAVRAVRAAWSTRTRRCAPPRPMPWRWKSTSPEPPSSSAIGTVDPGASQAGRPGRRARAPSRPAVSCGSAAYRSAGARPPTLDSPGPGR